MSTATLPTSSSPKTRFRHFKKEEVGLGLVALVFLAVTIRAAWLRPLVFHEFSTLFVASTPTMREMFRAIPADGNPPLYFLLVRLGLYLSIKTELAVRLPAIISYLFAALTVHWFVRRDAGSTAAWLAMSIFLGCSIHFYSIDGRPYSLLLFLTGLTLCCWQSYCRSGDRLALAGLVLSIAGAIYAHQYGVIYVMSVLFAGEEVRSVRRRRFDPAILIAAAMGGLTILLTAPPMLRGQELLLQAISASPVFAWHPRLSDLKDYGELLPIFVPSLVFLAFLGLLLKVALSPRNEPKVEAAGVPIGSEVPIEDIAATAALALMLPVILIITHIGSNYFQLRYGIGSAMGISLLCGLLLPRLRWRHAASLALVATIYCFLVGLLGLGLAAKPRRELWWTDPMLHAGNADEPIVIANAVRFPPIWWYSDVETRAKLHYLTDLTYAGKQSGLVPEYSLALERDYTPMRLDDYQTFLADHRRFLLYCTGEPYLEWVKQRLMHEGWHLRLLQSAPAIKLPKDEEQPYRELYEVSR
ncbi:MAG: glycosyltransferase family 39 protein [Acidobacteriaceae bacterium]|nr:glycosyltransferase family 39 protein [Acidobacteriaceae bacterium]